MRVTRESLVRIARETAKERSYNDRSIIAAYLTGSLAGKDDPILGGAADIDLVLVHMMAPPVAREIVKLTPDFHVDIQHRDRNQFRSPRELRADPYLGYEMYDPMLLSQSEKFFEFVQAGLRGGLEFHAPSLVLTRCRKLLGEARRCWIDLSAISGPSTGSWQVSLFLRAVGYAADSVAELNGGPLAERRFLLHFPARAEAAERPEFTETLFGLTGAPQIDAATIFAWLPAWAADFLAAAQDAKVDSNINSARLNYYEKGIRGLLEGETPLTALWPLLHSWALASQVLDPQKSSPWQAACSQLGLLGESFERRVSALDAFLDQIEVRLDEIAVASGVETSSRL